MTVFRDGAYAGDEAWKEWFSICSVDGCTAKDPLRRQVEGAMLGRLRRYGIHDVDVGNDDAVAFFDSYFKLNPTFHVHASEVHFRER